MSPRLRKSSGKFRLEYEWAHCAEMFKEHLAQGHTKEQAEKLLMLHGSNEFVKPKTKTHEAFDSLEGKFPSAFMSCRPCKALKYVLNDDKEIDFSQLTYMRSHHGRNQNVKLRQDYRHASCSLCERRQKDYGA
jgi:hypothetical protein